MNMKTLRNEPNWKNLAMGNNNCKGPFVKQDGSRNQINPKTLFFL